MRDTAMTQAASPSTDQRRPPQLQLGWLLEALPSLVPVNLRTEGLTAHTAVIAQSGSGESFMLGRLLEEGALKTRARVLILDPNSDLVKFGMRDDSAWVRHKGKFADDDTAVAFDKRWGQVGVSVATQRTAESLGLPGTTRIAPISISWPDLPTSSKANYLGLSVRT